MAIEVTKRPGAYNFSGNPVHYQLYSPQAASDNDITFEVKVLFKNIPDASFEELITLPFDPVMGYANIDLKEILDASLEYVLPTFPGNEKDAVSAPAQSGEFYLQFREITTASQNASWSDVESAHVRFVIKGGLNDFKYQGNNFWVNYFDVSQPFLTWQKSGRVAAYNERMYLGFLCDDEITSGKVRAVVTAYYIDGTLPESVSRDIDVQKGVVYYIPAGAAQWLLSALQPTKNIYYWTVQVWDYSDPDAPVAKSEAFKYELDNRNDDIGITLHYRNSLGCLDSLRILGSMEKKVEYDYTELETAVGPDYYSGHYFSPQKKIYNNTEQLVYSGNIGQVKKEELDRLRDAQMIREAWWKWGAKWVPVVITTKNFSLVKNGDNRFFMPVEFTLGYAGSRFYTPDIELGDGVFVDNVCLAYISPVNASVDLSGSDAAITITGTEVDPQNASAQFRYRFLNGVDVAQDWTTVAYSAFPITAHLPKEVIYTLELQALCSNGEYGKKTTLPVNTQSEVEPPPPPVGGSTYNSFIDNHTSFTSAYDLRINGVSVRSGTLGALNREVFDFPEIDRQNVVLVLTSVVPSESEIETDNGSFFGNIVQDGPGCVITYVKITAINGIEIHLY
ncbi:MAG: hypothetical protein ACTHKV_08485 [Flavipsychrobacter sp.]